MWLWPTLPELNIYDIRCVLVFLVEHSPYIHSFTVHIYNISQPYVDGVQTVFLQGLYQIYGHIQCMYMAMANPTKTIYIW
jgi:hypothetical protein